MKPDDENKSTSNKVIKTNKKPVFAMDLDETILVILDHAHLIDKRHILSAWFDALTIKNGEKKTWKIALINLDVISKLIEKACQKYGGILFLTAGYWDEDSIKQILIKHLILTPSSKKILAEAVFISSATITRYFPEKNPDDMQLIPKGQWLERYINANKEFDGTPLVILEDNLWQIDSFNHKQIYPVHSTTHKEHTSQLSSPYDCYGIVLDMLQVTAPKKLVPLHARHQNRNRVADDLKLKLFSNTSSPEGATLQDFVQKKPEKFFSFFQKLGKKEPVYKPVNVTLSRRGSVLVSHES